MQFLLKWERKFDWTNLKCPCGLQGEVLKLWVDWHITLTCFIFKVYTINLESKYVLVQGIPAVGAKKELLELFALYGAIDE